jgi:hypothetical protein
MPTPKRQHAPDNEPYHLDRLPPLYARPREADDDVERESVDPSLSQRGGVGTRPNTRELTADAQQLAQYLREALAFSGAQAFIQRFGTAAVRTALSDMAEGDTTKLKNPAGFLRWLVEQAYDRDP